MRRKRVLTKELKRRRYLKAQLDKYGWNQKDLAEKYKLDPSLFSRWFNDEVGQSRVERCVLDTLRELEEKEKRARKKGELFFV